MVVLPLDTLHTSNCDHGRYQLEYFAKTHVCQREYDTLDPDDIETGVDTENPYSGMQTAIFEMFEEHGRCYRWTTEDDLVERVENIP